MTTHPTIRQGEIYFLEDCPPLEGDSAKTRPVIVVSPPDVLHDSTRKIVVVAISSSVVLGDGIPLPDKSRYQNTSTNLTRPSWAIPRWFLPIDRRKLIHRVGYIKGITLVRVLAAVRAEMDRTS